MSLEDSETTCLIPRADASPCERRPKRSCWQLTTNSTIMLGRELCYGLEAALVVPHLLTRGMPTNMYSLVFLIPPMFGFLLQPVMGSTSDRCRSPLGRRRPFILTLDVTIMFGLILFLNDDNVVKGVFQLQAGSQSATVVRLVVATVGAVLFMFAADSIEGPVRAYLLDTCNAEDQRKGLDLQAAFAGIGGVLGYMSGAVDWKKLGVRPGSEDLVRFGICFSLFVVCAILNLLSIPEKPLARPGPSEKKAKDTDKDTNVRVLTISTEDRVGDQQDTWEQAGGNRIDHSTVGQSQENDTPADVPKGVEKSVSISFTTFFKSIVKMPGQLARLCLTQLIAWLGFMAIMLFFTDFMGRRVYGGVPEAAAGSEARRRYEAGVQMGCWGLTINAAACAFISGLADLHLGRLGLRTVYMGGTLLFAVGMAGMVLLVELTDEGWPFYCLRNYRYRRFWAAGMGVDCALLTTQIQLSRVIIGAVMGPIVNAAGTLTVVVIMAGGLAFCTKADKGLSILPKPGCHGSVQGTRVCAAESPYSAQITKFSSDSVQTAYAM
ncbi:hypothetical protein Bbelb_437310 [Branchiostoma belcheri]|nr:hypothetical protein Bbelb_437310 [Branchiostoma belcheri]